MSVRRLAVPAAIIATVGLAAAFGFAQADAKKPADAPKAAAAAGGSFKVDGVHSAVIYKISHMGVSNFYGRFNKVTGNFTWDSAKPEASTIDVKIESDSIDSNNKGRDTHLKGPDFFNVKEYPEISFTAKSLAKTGADWTLTGDLTLLGKSNSVSAKFVPTGEKDAGGQFGYRAGFEAHFKIKRSDFGMSYGVNNGSLGDEVDVIVAIEGIKQ